MPSVRRRAGEKGNRCKSGTTAITVSGENRRIAIGQTVREGAPIRKDRKSGDLLGFRSENILGQMENAADKFFYHGKEGYVRALPRAFFVADLFGLFTKKSHGSKRMKRRLALILGILMLSGMLFFAAACAKNGQKTEDVTVSYGELVSTGKEENTFAQLFSIEHFTDGEGRRYSEIEIYDKNKALSSSWLLLPEGVSGAEGVPETTQVMTAQDRANILVSSASTMSLINAMDALDKVPMTTSDTTWYIEEIKQAIGDGTVQEVGKYNAPDYEKILTVGTEKHVTFAVFSTMIDYVPQVEEMLSQTCRIRIMRDQSSSESHPLARTEWIKVFGEIFGLRTQSDAVFDAQVKALNDTLKQIGGIPESERKSVLIFYTTADKSTYNVRNAEDYVTKLVSLAGGRQVAEIGAGKSGNTKMDAETFVSTCAQADYILYNWTSGASGVEDESLQGLIDARLGDWFKQFRAYQEGNVWRTSRDFYQKMDKMGEMVADIYQMLYGNGSSDALTYVDRLS